MKANDPVLITTKHRGVFFGYLNGDPGKLPGEVQLKKARNCLFWSRDVRGFIGLATTGPSSSCRIGPVVESITIYDVTSMAAVEDRAISKWEDAPWNS